MGLHIVFLSDPIETFVLEKDTTYALMKEAFLQGHRISYLRKGAYYCLGGKVSFELQDLISIKDSTGHFELSSSYPFLGDDVDVLFVRTDPPFNEDYLHHMWILSLLEGVLIVNSPEGIRAVNEKIWVNRYSDLTPLTLITRHKKAYDLFLKEQKKVVIKPCDGFGGSGIFVISDSDTNKHVIFEILTANGSRDIIVQAYIEDVSSGDKRILLLEGEILGAVLRKQLGDDHRHNFFAGGKALQTTVDSADKMIVSRIKPMLQALGLFFVGIDVIGGKLIEVNVTSPTCLQEMTRLDQKNYAARIINRLEAISS